MIIVLLKADCYLINKSFFSMGNYYKILTIIIPVYKVEKYIRQCLDSVIVEQNLMERLEIIIVNDGTPDHSGLIAHEYQYLYPNTIKVVDKDNGGHGSAWNVGLRLAKGKYVHFLDSDDWFSNLSDFIIRLSTTETDLVFTHINRFYENKNQMETCLIKGVYYDQVYDKNSFSFLDSGNQHLIYNFWYCTYKTEILQKEQPLFVEKVFYDDVVLYLATLMLGKDMVFFDMVLYNYRLGRVGQSVDIKVEMAHVDDIVKVTKCLVDFSNNHTILTENQRKQRDAILSIYLRYRWSLITKLPFKDFKRVAKIYFPIIESASYIKKSPKMLLYKYTNACISWSLVQFFNDYILKIINKE